MKKVLIGLGIGCGSLVLLGIIGLVAGGLWAKGKVEEYAGDLEAVGKKAEESQKRVSALNEKYAFEAPAKGTPVSIEEKRLQEYLAVRTALQPVWQTYAQKAKELENSAGNNPGIGDAFKAVGQLSTFFAELQSTWLDQLDGKRMSPKEYHAITAALYSSNWGAAMGDFKKQQRPMFEQTKKTLEEQLANTTDEELKNALKEQLASVDEQLAELPPADAEPSESDKTHKANLALYEKYKAQIEEQAEKGLDLLLVGDDGSSLGNAFENLNMGGEEENAE